MQAYERWSQVAEDNGTMQAPSSALTDTSVTAPRIHTRRTDMATDVAGAAPTAAPKEFISGRWESKPEFTAAEKEAARREAARRALPMMRYGDCNASVPANGALRNEAFTSIW